MSYTISTDATCDLPESFASPEELHVIPMSYTLDGVTYSGTEGDRLTTHEFFEKMKAGGMPQTVQINTEESKAAFESILEKGLDVLHISFSSALSGTYNSARLAAEELNEKYGRVCVTVVDSLCASLGEGLIVHYALEMQRAGKTLEEVAAWLEANKLHLCHIFTVNDLFHLHRGGRVSMASAIVGSMLGIKPILHVDDNGRLIPIGKVRGRSAALGALVENMALRVGDYPNDTIFICEGDCLSDAQNLAGRLRQRFGNDKKILINSIGPVIGSHSGPGTLAVFFLGDYR